MSYKVKKIMGLTAIAVLTVMLLFPPWKIETGKRSRIYSEGYSPSRIVSGQYGFLFNPPSKAKGIDFGRLTMQFLLVGVVGVGVIGMNRMKRSSRSQDDGGEQLGDAEQK